MTSPVDWNTKIIEEFRANDGKVGGNFEGADIVLMHHHGRKSGKEYVNPVVFRPDPDDSDTIYVFASKAGAPDNPDWYYNLIADPEASVEVGTEHYPVTVRELEGAERDAVYEAHAARYAAFADYADKTSGVRTIPVLGLTRVR